MHTGDPTDVTSTLTDLERKLVDLERELSTVAGGASPAPRAPLPVPPSPVETRAASMRVEDLRGEITELARFREQLESAARELVSEYDRLVARLQGAPGAAPPSAAFAPSHPGPPAAPPMQGHVPATPPNAGLPPSPIAPAPASGADAHDELPFEGAVVVDAGPFRDIASLQAFEQALGRVEGAQDVYVQAFEGDRAHVDVRLSNPVPLVRLLRQQLHSPMMVRAAGDGRLTVDVTTDTHGP